MNLLNADFNPNLTKIISLHRFLAKNTIKCLTEIRKLKLGNGFVFTHFKILINI